MFATDNEIKSKWVGWWRRTMKREARKDARAVFSRGRWTTKSHRVHSRNVNKVIALIQRFEANSNSERSMAQLSKTLDTLWNASNYRLTSIGAWTNVSASPNQLKRYFWIHLQVANQDSLSMMERSFYFGAKSKPLVGHTVNVCLRRHFNWICIGPTQTECDCKFVATSIHLQNRFARCPWSFRVSDDSKLGT